MKIKNLILEISINQLESKIKGQFPKLRLILSFNKMGNYLQIDQIIIPTELRNQGIGSKVIQKILKYADDHQLKVSLSPSSDYGGNLKRLYKFYQSLGFVRNSGKNRDYETSDSLLYLG